MSKVVYDKRGLVQERGDGFFLNGETYLNGPNFTSVSTKNANTTISTENIILGDASSAEITLTLPNASTITGRTLNIKKIDSTINAVVISGSNSQTIDGASNQKIIEQYISIQLIASGSSWYIL